MYELNPNEFLYLFYTKTSQKLKRILELVDINVKSTENVKEIYETKSKLVEAIDMLALSTNDDKLKDSFDNLASLIISTDKKHIQSALDFCTEVRTRG